MKNIINADFRVVQQRTPEVVCTEIKMIETHVCQTVLEGAVQIGKRLAELKGMLGHGNWLSWCKENLEYSDRQVRRYMEIAENYGNENSVFSKWTMSSDFSISKAYSLLSLPEEDVESFTEEHDIESMTVANLEAEIKSWKAKNESLSTELDKSKAQNEELQKVVEESEVRHQELIKDLEELKESETSPEEIEKLKAELAKEQAKAQKAKDALAKEKEKTKHEIEKAVGAAAEELQKAADKKNSIEIQRLERQKKLAEDKVVELAKKLEQSNSEDITLFKIKAEELQLTFRDMREVVHNVRKHNPEQAEKMECAMRQILDKFEESMK